MHFNLKRLLLAALCVPTMSRADQPPSSYYQDLGTMVLRAEKPLAINNNRPQLKLGHENSQPEQQEKVDLTIKISPRNEQLQTWFTLLDQACPIDAPKRLFTDIVVEKLNLISGPSNNKQGSIIGNLPLLSKIGTASTAEMITTTTTSERNQEIIRYFVENPQELRAVQSALKKIESGTGLYLGFFKPTSKAEDETFAKLFYGKWLGKYLGFNKSITALNVLRLFQRGWNAKGFLPLAHYKWLTKNMQEAEFEICKAQAERNVNFLLEEFEKLKGSLTPDENQNFSMLVQQIQERFKEELAKSPYFAVRTAENFIAGKDLNWDSFLPHAPRPIQDFYANLDTRKIAIGLLGKSKFYATGALHSVKDVYCDTVISHYPHEYSTYNSTSRPAPVMGGMHAPGFSFRNYEEKPGQWICRDESKRYYSFLDAYRFQIGNLGGEHANTNKALLFTCLPYLLDIVDAYRAYSATHNIAHDNSLMENLQVRLMGIARIAEGLVILNKVAQRSELASMQELVSDIEDLLEHRHGSSDLGTLINNLLTDTFKGSPSWASNRPRILATYTLMQENKVEFVPALRAAGMMDALQAAAQMYLQHQNTPAHYCFVEFVEDEHPTVQLKNFWNPLMPAKKAVCNSVHLGKGGDRNMMLTGPNGSGKSVNMKGIALNVVLAQVFGIAAADKAVLTPFTMIEIYLNEQEDLQQGLSTFMAEAKKLDDICRRLARLKKGERTFFLIDEPLKGSVEETGAQKIYDACLAIAKIPRVITIMTTHFEKPTNIADETNGAFGNYHVGLEETSPGTFVRTFKLIRGANLWWFKDPEKRSRFVNWLTHLGD